MTDSATAPTAAPIEPAWLSHHDEREADRCVLVGSTHVCRRCLVMYAAFVPALVAMLTVWSDQLDIGDVWAPLALTVAAGIEFLLVAIGRMPYRAGRVWLLTPAVGCTLAWLVVVGYRDGFGMPHVVLGGLAGLLLLALLGARRSGIS